MIYTYRALVCCRLKLKLGDDGKPLTPGCGACATEEASDFDPSTSGFMWTDLSEVVAMDAMNKTVTAALIPAGAVRQAHAYADGNECAFGRTYRVAKLGGNFVAAGADFPQPALYIIEGATQKVSSIVPTENNPTRIGWVPTRTRSVTPILPPVESSSEGDLGVILRCIGSLLNLQYEA